MKLEVIIYVMTVCVAMKRNVAKRVSVYLNIIVDAYVAVPPKFSYVKKVSSDTKVNIVANVL